MPERNLPAWASGIGAELRDRTDKLPINEPYLVDVAELLREMTERQLAERRLRSVAKTVNKPTPRARGSRSRVRC